MVNFKVMTDTELIAAFMGHGIRKVIGPFTGNEYLQVCINGDWYVDRYHESWNLLMPIVEKIEDTGGVNVVSIDRSGCRIQLDGLIKEITIDTFGGNSKIHAVHLACVIFIKWYNAQQK